MLRWTKLAVVLAVLCLSALAFSQGGATGAITGTAQDASGAVIAGAQVNVINEATGQVVRRLSTDSSGTVTATLLPVGTYSLELSAPGFATSKVSGIVVRITETTRLTAAMTVTPVKELLDVQAQVATIETTTATTGAVSRLDNNYDAALGYAKLSAVTDTLGGGFVGFE